MLILKNLFFIILFAINLLLSSISSNGSALAALNPVKKVCQLSKQQISDYEKKGFRLLAVYLENDSRCAEFLPPITEAEILKGQNEIKNPSYKVYKDYDSIDSGIRAQLYRLSKSYPDISELQVIGTTEQNREIVALKITDKSIQKTKGKVLYVGLHHASEWPSVEMVMRLTYLLLKNYSTDPKIKDLVQNCEIFVVPVINPDGYQYSITKDIYWRKNMHDNDGDGKFNPAIDGVDLNRNYDYMWAYDEFGSTSYPGGFTYRGKAPFSEPETRAIRDLIQREAITYALTYHTNGDYILYPHGYVDNLEPPDFPMFKHLAGTKEHPAIFDSLRNFGYRPMLASELYTVNGEMIDWAYARQGVIAFTVELTSGYGLALPDNEVLMEKLFLDNLPFMLDIATSAKNPTNPVSHINQNLSPVLHKPLTKSYGTVQEVELFAKKGAIVDLNYNSPSGENFWNRFNIIEKGKYFDRYVSRIRHLISQVSYYMVAKFFNETKRFPENGTYNYNVIASSNRPILIVAAEISGTNQTPKYLNFYLDALKANGYEGKYDVYIKSPNEIIDYFEVLSHYKVIIWYGGDNVLPISVGQDLELSKALKNGERGLFFSGQFASNINYRYLKNLLYYQFGIREIGINPITSSLKSVSLKKVTTDKIFTTDLMLSGNNLKSVTNLKTFSDYVASNVNFVRSNQVQSEQKTLVGPSISTDNTIFFGFGFETIADPNQRKIVMKNVLDYLSK